MGIRRNITLNATARDDYVRGVLALKAELTGISTADLGFGVAPGASHQQLSTWDLFVIWHVWAMQTMTPAASSNNPRGRNAAHRGPAFLPWHRWLMILLEWQFQRVLGNNNFGLPYWNWATDGSRPVSQQPSRPIWRNNAMGGNGSISSGFVATGPFRGSQFRVLVETDSAGDLQATNRPLRRRFGSTRPALEGGPFGLPTRQNVTPALNETNYDEADWDIGSGEFRNRLEGWTPSHPQSMLHNRVHVWIGGDMGPSTSPNDPAFYLNHCNVDRIWAAWQAKNPARPYLPTSSAPSFLFRHRRSDALHSALTSIAPTPAQLLNVANLYTYDNLVVN